MAEAMLIIRIQFLSKRQSVLKKPSMTCIGLTSSTPEARSTIDADSILIKVDGILRGNIAISAPERKTAPERDSHSGRECCDEI